MYLFVVSLFADPLINLGDVNFCCHSGQIRTLLYRFNTHIFTNLTGFHTNMCDAVQETQGEGSCVSYSGINFTRFAAKVQQNVALADLSDTHPTGVCWICGGDRFSEEKNRGNVNSAL